MQFDNSYSRLHSSFYSKVEPTPLANPFMISWNRNLAYELGLEGMQPEQVASHFGAMEPMPGSEPIAAAYAGHQFGHFVPQLGDGRSILLGELLAPSGQRWDFHLKGAGPTPYSRRGDGRAVLRSTIREYLCSEAMHGLGIPTTRALTIVGSEEEVYRESLEYGATLLRLSPTHIRFGTFEYFYYKNQFDHIPQLIDHLVQYHLPDLQDVAEKERSMAFFREVSKRTAALIAQWQLVGFSHGVMNTDNMSVLGLTIDYGPYGFLDHYDPNFICNHSDHTGRYAFNRQPEIAQWNLSCLGQTLLPFISDDVEQGKAQLVEEIECFQERYQQHFNQGFSNKLGIEQYQKEDQRLHRQWLDLLEQQQVDYTLAFRILCHTHSEQEPVALFELFSDRAVVIGWFKRYQKRLAQQQMTPRQVTTLMLAHNPKYILRNYMAQQAIEAAEQGDYGEIERLLKLLQAPFDEQRDLDRYAEPPPQWAKSLSVSCSS